MSWPPSFFSHPVHYSVYGTPRAPPPISSHQGLPVGLARQGHCSSFEFVRLWTSSLHVFMYQSTREFALSGSSIWPIIGPHDSLHGFLVGGPAWAHSSSSVVVHHGQLSFHVYETADTFLLSSSSSLWHTLGAHVPPNGVLLLGRPGWCTWFVVRGRHPPSVVHWGPC